MGVAWLLTVAVEGVVLWYLLHPMHAPRTRWFAAAWLSACTLPLVHLGFPALRAFGASDAAWIALAEVFAPLAEVALFALVVAPVPAGHRLAAGSGAIAAARRRDATAIVIANLASFAVGLLLR
ncbi:MAG: hypothetical protein IT361_00635 [Gemmatimonadaceae bacterium]|nr:hypothetical protein [Gemmatimonadaceae bacterium]